MNNSEYAELRDSMNKAIHCIKTLAESIGTDSTPDIPKDSIFEVNYFLRVALDMWQDDIDDTEQEGGYNNPWEMFSLVVDADELSRASSAYNKLETRTFSTLDWNDINALWWLIWQYANTYEFECSQAGIDVDYILATPTLF